MKEAGTRGRAPASVDNIQHLFCRVATLSILKWRKNLFTQTFPFLPLPPIETLLD
jgi:hypothetical protein